MRDVELARGEAADQVVGIALRIGEGQLAQIARLDRDNGPWMDVALITFGIALQFTLAAFLDWWRQASAALNSNDARTGNRIAEPDEPERALAQGVR